MPHINFFDTAQLNPLTGYGKMELGLVREFVKRDFEVSFPKSLDIKGLEYIKQTSELGKNIVNNLSLRNQDLNLIVGTPLNPPKRGVNVLYTMSESDKVSDKWVNSINENYSLVFVPCDDLVEIYNKSGVKVPVEKLALGMDFPEFIKFIPRSMRKRDKFVFLTYSYGDIRKGADLAIMAFKQAFAHDTTKELWIKCRTKRGNWLNKFEDSQVRIIEGDYTEAQWLSLLGKADAFVFPTRGEGFGLPPREAALTGLPTLATRWLGTQDIGRWGLPIEVETMRQALFDGNEAANSKDAQWAMPSVESIKKGMESIVKEYQGHLIFTKEVAVPYLRLFTWESTVNEMIGKLNDYGLYND